MQYNNLANAPSPQFRMAESRYYLQTSNHSNSGIQNLRSPSLTNSLQKQMNGSNEKANESNNKLSESSLTQSMYDTVEPLQIQCQQCHTFSSSIVVVEATNYTYICALVLTLVLLCWVPFVFKKYFMLITHRCPGCDLLVGQYNYLESKFEN